MTLSLLREAAAEDFYAVPAIPYVRLRAIFRAGVGLAVHDGRRHLGHLAGGRPYAEWKLTAICGMRRKWGSVVRSRRPCCIALAASQRSFAGAGVPARRSSSWMIE